MMTVIPVNFTYKKSQNYRNYTQKNQDFGNKINFHGVPYENRVLNNKPILFSQNFADSLISVIYDKQAYLGQGMSKKAYSLEKIGYKDYVLGVPKNCKLEDLQKKFEYVKDYFPNNNFGQVIAKNDADIVIMKYVTGAAHGIASDIIANNNQISREAAIKFCNQLKTLSEFDDSAYIDLAAQFKTLNQINRFFVDVNPNNLLVDFEKQRFSIIDLNDKNIIPIQRAFKSDVNTMISIFLDSLMHMKIYEKLDDIEKENYNKFSKIIINKCKKAANIVNLEKSPITMSQYFDLLMKYDMSIHNRQYKTLWSERYNDFREHYKSVLPIE